jgi:hypothetical protein
MGILIIQDNVYAALPADFRWFLKRRLVERRGDQGAYRVSNEEYARMMLKVWGRGLERWLPLRMRRQARQKRREAAMMFG